MTIERHYYFSFIVRTSQERRVNHSIFDGCSGRKRKRKKKNLTNARRAATLLVIPTIPLYWSVGGDGYYGFPKANNGHAVCRHLPLTNGSSVTRQYMRRYHRWLRTLREKPAEWRQPRAREYANAALLWRSTWSTIKRRAMARTVKIRCTPFGKVEWQRKRGGQQVKAHLVETMMPITNTGVVVRGTTAPLLVMGIMVSPDVGLCMLSGSSPSPFDLAERFTAHLDRRHDDTSVDYEHSGRARNMVRYEHRDHGKYRCKMLQIPPARPSVTGTIETTSKATPRRKKYTV